MAHHPDTLKWPIWSGTYPAEASNAFRVGWFIKDWLVNTYSFLTEKSEYVDVDVVVWDCSPNPYGSLYGVSAIVNVHPLDEGVVIGPRGNIIKAVRAYAAAIQGKEKMPVRIEINLTGRR